MAYYGYKSRGYTPQENRIGPRFEGWEASNDGVETHSHGRGKTVFGNNSEGYRDHVCRPVIIDAEGRKRPLIACDANHDMDGYVTKTETIVEQVQLPQLTTQYRTSYPAEMGRAKDYGVPNNGWNRPLSPSYDRPPIVDEFISKVQTEASRPSRINLVSSMYWRQKPNNSGYGGTNVYGGRSEYGTNTWNKPSSDTVRDPYLDNSLERNYMVPDGNQERTIVTTNEWTRPSHTGGQSEYGTNTWNKPSSYTVRDPYFDSSLGRNHMVPDVNHEPTIVTTNEWTRPSRTGWETPPSNNIPLSKPTNDIGAAIDYLKEAANPTSVTMPPARQFTAPTPMAPKLDRSLTIDSREARRKYGNISASPQTIKTADYSSALDSREAARRFNGQIL